MTDLLISVTAGFAGGVLFWWFERKNRTSDLLVFWWSELNRVSTIVMDLAVGDLAMEKWWMHIPNLESAQARFRVEQGGLYHLPVTVWTDIVDVYHTLDALVVMQHTMVKPELRNVAEPNLDANMSWDMSGKNLANTITTLAKRTQTARMTLQKQIEKRKLLHRRLKKDLEDLEHVLAKRAEQQTAPPGNT